MLRWANFAVLAIESTWLACISRYPLGTGIVWICDTHSAMKSHLLCTCLQGRTISLSFVLYFDERYYRLSERFELVQAMQPSHVFFNTGLWLYSTSAICTEWDEHDKLQSTQRGSRTECPSMSGICSLFGTVSERAYPKESGQFIKLYWQTTTLQLHRRSMQRVEVPIGPGHHLDVADRCRLPPERVVNRTQALLDLEPDWHKLHRLFLPGDHLHFTRDPYHAFNADVLQALDGET